MLRTVCVLALASLAVAYDAGLRGSIYFAIDGINRGSGLDKQLVLEEVLRSAERVVSRVETQHVFSVRLAYSDCRNGATDALSAAQRCPVADVHRSVDCTASVTQVTSDAAVRRRLVDASCAGALGTAASLDSQAGDSAAQSAASLDSQAGDSAAQSAASLDSQAGDSAAQSDAGPGTYEAGVRGSIYFAIDSINQRSGLDNQWVLEEALRSSEQVVSREESRHSFAVRLAYSDCPNGAPNALLSAQRCTVPDPHRSQECRGSVIQLVTDSGVRRRIAELSCSSVLARQAVSESRDVAPVASLSVISLPASYDAGLRGSIYFAIDAINRGSGLPNQWVLEEVMKSAQEEVSDVESVHRFAVRLAYSQCRNGDMDALTATMRCPVPDPHRSQDCTGSVVQQVSATGTAVRRRVLDTNCGATILQAVLIQG